MVSCLFLIMAQAQQNLSYPFYHITQADGLLHNGVYSITQDVKGFIWVGTQKGVQRFDGLRFVNYTDSSDSPGEENRVIKLYADNSNSSIWLYKHSQFKQLQLLQNKFSLIDNKSLLQQGGEKYTDRYGSNWIIQTKDIHQADNENKSTVFLLPFIKNNEPIYVSSFGKDAVRNQTWVIGFNNRLLLFDGSSREIYSQDYNPIFHPLLRQFKDTRYHLRAVTMDKNQNIWITTWGPDIFRYNSINKQLYTYSLADFIQSVERRKIFTGSVNTMMEDDHGVLWLGTTNGGLLQYNPQKDKFNYILYQQGNITGIEYNFDINSLFQDKEQNIWVGTDKGISVFSPYGQYFTIIKYDQYNLQSLPKNEINSMIQAASGDLIIGTWGGGISVYDNGFHFKKTISFADAIQKNEVWSFVQNNDGTIWAGCQKGFIHIIDVNKLSVHTIHPPEMENSTIRCMIKDSAGNIWLGLQNGKIVEWNNKKKSFQPFEKNFQNDLLPPAPVTNIFIDKSKNFWVSTWFGLKQLDTGKRSFIANYKSNKKDNTAISSSRCLGIEDYNDSTLLVGTQDGGLNLFNKKTKTFSHFASDELSSKTVYAIKKDAAGYIWVTTDYCLYKFNDAGKKTIPYNIESGIFNSPFTANNFYPLQNGQWITFTHTEIVSFSPYKTGYSANPNPKTEITALKVFSNPVFIDSLLFQNKPVQLSYKNNFLTVEFAVLNFSGVQQTNYYYRLSGIDKDWVNGGTKQVANYTNLPSGKYVFEVKAQQGNNNGAITFFKIIITPPWWKTWWFIVFVSCSIFLFAYLFIKWRIKNMRAIAEEKLKVQQLSADQYKSKLELEQIINYFSSSLIDKNTTDEVLWDVAKNLIGRLGFEDCILYLWNSDKTKMIQKAGFGPKGSVEQINKQPSDVLLGQGVVGHVMQTKEALLIPDTSKDVRYRQDVMLRLSEIAVPVIYNNELIGVIHIEHHEKNYYTTQHLQIMNTIATLMANKIKSIEAEQLLQRTNIEMYGMNELLLKAKLEALRAQMNPHFIFNCLNSIDNLIQMNEKEKATLYLSKFAKLIRSILENATSNVIPCWKDMETLKLYIELEELRFDKKFAYQIIISDEIANGDYKVPPLIVQPFVENAIHHGLLNKVEGDRKLLICVGVTGNHIHYLIEDNGVGRAKANSYKQLNKPSHQSMGMQITTDRINLFNHGKNGYVTITDMIDEWQHPCGTRVEIELINQ